MMALCNTLVDDSKNWSTYQFCCSCFMFVFDQSLVEHVYRDKSLFKNLHLAESVTEGQALTQVANKLS